MKIIGVVLQRNEVDSILFSVMHHLKISGLDEIIVGDNGSTDGSKEALICMSRSYPRLTVLDMDGEYRKVDRVNEMYQLAIAKGADWIIPLDADEFLPLHVAILNVHSVALSGQP